MANLTESIKVLSIDIMYDNDEKREYMVVRDCLNKILFKENTGKLDEKSYVSMVKTVKQELAQILMNISWE